MKMHNMLWFSVNLWMFNPWFLFFVTLFVTPLLFCIRPSGLAVLETFSVLHSPQFSQGYFSKSYPFSSLLGSPPMVFPLFLRVMPHSAPSSFHILLVTTLPSQVTQNMKVNRCLSLLHYFDFTDCSVTTCISVLLFLQHFSIEISILSSTFSKPCIILYSEK